MIRHLGLLKGNRVSRVTSSTNLCMYRRDERIQVFSRARFTDRGFGLSIGEQSRCFGTVL